MNKVGHILNILAGIGMILCGIAFAMFPNDTYKIIIFLLCIGLLFDGIRELWFYIRMAHHMVGGRTMLYRSIIVIDMGLFTLSLTDVSMVYVMLYLVGIHLFTGGIDILRANEARKLQAGSWKLQFTQGVINVIIAVLCIINFKSIPVAVTIYAAGLIYSGIMRIVQALRRTEIVYIQ